MIIFLALCTNLAIAVQSFTSIKDSSDFTIMLLTNDDSPDSRLWSTVFDMASNRLLELDRENSVKRGILKFVHLDTQDL